MPLPEEARAERADWLCLALTPGLGPAGTRALLAAFGSPRVALGAGYAALAACVGPAVARALITPDPKREDAVGRTLDWAAEPGHHLLALTDPDYPEPLRQIPDPPTVLFVAGASSRLASAALAVVGSRSATRAGLAHAGGFARALGEAGLTVVSGLARGVDGAAHRGALGTAGGTVAVLGTGVDRPYPAVNAPLAEQILADGGALVSELPLGTEARPGHFPRRNRLIAGLSAGVLVIEAALRSGSLITARLAAEFGREVFAIPGSVHAPLARGCHALIRQGAALVEAPADVLAELPVGLAPRSVAPTAAAGRPATEEDPLLRAIGWDPISAEALAVHWQRHHPDAPPAGLTARLLALELAGAVERLPDGRLQRRG